MKHAATSTRSDSSNSRTADAMRLRGKAKSNAATGTADAAWDVEGENADVAKERRPAKMVTALPIDLDTQVELEAAAAARGIGSSTLMREILEEWVRVQKAPRRVNAR